MTMLEFAAVSHEYPVSAGASLGRPAFRALDDVSFGIGPGESLGLVGESGSGKSTIARLAVGLLQATQGTITLGGKPLQHLRGRMLREARRSVGFVFQDPYASLNPRQQIGTALELPLRVHTSERSTAIRRRVLELLDRVGLTPADHYLYRFPHQLSGGQRQRVAIARAIALRPRLVIADEPVASLDVSIAGQILNLLREVSRELGSSLLFISHDLGLVRAMCERTIVLSGGRLVEAGPTMDVLSAPVHPYTQLLLASMPETLQLNAIDPAEPVREDAAEACPFLARCRYATDRCRAMPPPQTVGAAHTVRCWLTEADEPAAGWLAAGGRGATGVIQRGVECDRTP
ncbi:MAG: ABC transporter ATP-binding protein [Candidatus Dormiibacterota bacterium]